MLLQKYCFLFWWVFKRYDCKTSCELVDNVYVEGDKPGNAECLTKEEYKIKQEKEGQK